LKANLEVLRDTQKILLYQLEKLEKFILKIAKGG